MPDPSNYVNPLGGNEVVADILAQVKKRLATDCNLRATDGYSGGYSGTVTVKLKLHAVRITDVDTVIPISESPELKAPSVEEFSPEDVEPIEIDETISIPQEENLQEVRERTKENNKEEDEPEVVAVEEADIPARAKRKYTRRTAIVGAVTGE